MNTIKQGISRGDIFYADLSPIVGCEQGGVRPVLILQNDIGNRHSPTTIICAITGKPKKPLPTHTAVAGAGRLSRESFALLEQIRTIDRIRLREWVGRLDEQKIIAGQIDALEAEAMRLEALYTRKLASLDELKQSLLHQAFSGEL